MGTNIRRLSVAGLTVVLVFFVGSACSLLEQTYYCSERDELSAGCSCRTRAPRNGQTTPRCKEEYDCCVAYRWGSVLPDDPSNQLGAGCYCWDLSPGQTCKDVAAQYDHGGSRITGHPTTCPGPRFF